MSRPDRRAARPDGQRSSGADVIFWRMSRLDKGQGCHASLKTISHPGKKGDPNSKTFSIAQTRRHVAWLRAKGQIIYTGSTLNGCNVYLFPDRKQYDPSKVPVYENRPALWSTDAAQALYSSTPPACVEPFRIDGYEVNTRIRSTYSEATIKAAISRIRSTRKYKDERNIQDHSALLTYFCKILSAQRRKAEATLRAELAKREASAHARKSKPALGRWGAMAEAEAELHAFLTRHQRHAAVEPDSPAGADAPPPYSHAADGRTDGAGPVRQAHAPP